MGGGLWPMSKADPRLSSTTWRRSIRTSFPTGGMEQSGTSTQIDSLVEPATTTVPKTDISVWRRRLVEIGLDAKSWLIWLNAAKTTCTHPVSPVNVGASLNGGNS